MANFMKFVDQRPDQENAKQEDPWQLGSDDTEPTRAEMPRPTQDDGIVQVEE